jgi:hypothetical protein
VPRALSGEFERVADETRGARRRKPGDKPPSVAAGIQEIFSGIGFVVVSLMVSKYAPAGSLWWYWLLIPAFISFGKGISEFVRVRQLRASPFAATPQFQPSVQRPEIPPAAAPTSQLLATPPSVTEGTTRHLGAEAATKHLDSINGRSE